MAVRFARVGVLMGGPSSERDISLKSGRAVCNALAQSKFPVMPVDISTESLKENIGLLKSAKIDCAFLALHGRFGEDGQIQQILEMLNIPYTGSGVSASRLAMDKVASRYIFKTYGLSVPKFKVIEKGHSNTALKYFYNLTLPLVIKPASHGSSIGLSIIKDYKQIRNALKRAFSFDEKVIIEEYIRGRELTVGILDKIALPIIEIVPKKFFFDYEAKYHSRMTDYIVPARLPKQISKKIQSTALSAHNLLGCYGCSRIDLILDGNNIPYILEVNTIPGLTETSLLPKAAKSIGIEFGELCLRLLNKAYEKKENQALL